MKHFKPKSAESQVKYLLSVQNKTTHMWFIDSLSYDSYEVVLRDLKELMKVLQPDEYVYTIQQKKVSL